jgi:hypothetical protein
MRNLSILLILVSIMFACEQKEFSSVDELSKFVADPKHEFTQQAESNGVKITLAYRPTDLLVAQELGESSKDVAAIDNARKKYGQYYYFILSLSANNTEALTPSNSGDKYSELVQTLSFRMHDYVTMTTSASDTIPVGDFMLNRTYGLSQSTDILFVFNREKSNDQEWVQFNLNEFGLNTGNQRFRFSVKKLEDAPHLALANVRLSIN